MGNYSMYETLMNLPLFRGAGEDLISAIIEKTHLSFDIYERGDVICSQKRNCETVLALISGKISVSSIILDGKLKVTQTVGAGRFLGFDHLWGLDTKFPYTVTALERCGTIEFPKKQYISLLQSHQILLFNCLNYLSYSSQKSQNFLKELNTSDDKSLLLGILNTCTFRDAEEIVLESTGKPIMDCIEVFPEPFLDAVRTLEEAGAVEIKDNKFLKILSRTAFMDGLI